MELRIIDGLRNKTTLAVELLECYEPGDVQFQHLQKVDFGLQTKLHHAMFSASTNLAGEYYDVITMFHVHYYWKDREERRLVMENLLWHLKPSGVVFILLLNEVTFFIEL